MKFLLAGGRIAAKNAVISCLFVVPFNLILLAFFYSWQDGMQLLASGLDIFRDSIAALIFMLPISIIVSSIPAFLGGVILAWLITLQSRFLSMVQKKLNLGAVIGAFAGLLLISSILVPGDFSSRNAHGGIGYDWNAVAPMYMFYGLEFVIASTIAGARADLQLRKQWLDAKINTA